jgi:ribosomal protein S18 acetylase RimI-like enzyme
MRVRTYRLDDYEALLRVQRECFPPPFPVELLWTREQIESHVATFPAGCLCAEADGELIGSATAHIIRWNPLHAEHTWREAADDGYLRNHDPQGDTLYGVDIAVRPTWRGHGVARALYRARYDLVRKLRLKRFVAGSRISGYHRFSDRLSPEEYTQAVIAGQLDDPVITPQLRAGLEPVQLLREYLDDAEAANCALLMQWRNPELPQ